MRPEKESMINEIRKGLEDTHYVFLADYRGLSVEQLSNLRGRLRPSGARLHVIRNAFLKRAVDGPAQDGILALVEGPIAMITSGDDVTVIAKVLKKFRAENNLPIVRGGKLGDRLLSPEDIEEMARIPSREVLLGKLVGTIAAPVVQMVGTMREKVLSLLYVLKAVEEKKSH